MRVFLCLPDLYMNSPEASITHAKMQYKKWSIAIANVLSNKIWYYTEFRGKKNYFIPNRFLLPIAIGIPHSSENFVGMTRFYEVRRQMRRTSTWFGYAHHRTLSDQAAFALNT